MLNSAKIFAANFNHAHKRRAVRFSIADKILDIIEKHLRRNTDAREIFEIPPWHQVFRIAQAVLKVCRRLAVNFRQPDFFVIHECFFHSAGVSRMTFPGSS